MMATEKRLIDANALKIHRMHNAVANHPLDVAYRKDIDNAPTVDAVEIDVLEDWLMAMANEYFGSAFCRVCCDIADRLDNLRTFAKERKTDGN